MQFAVFLRELSGDDELRGEDIFAVINVDQSNGDKCQCL